MQNDKHLTIEESRTLQYNILKELHRACGELGLTYYLAYGTLLGAVRHKGFIPWDDDIDVMMPMSDFLRLQDAYRSERYEVVSCYNRSWHWFASMGRIYDKRTYRLKRKAHYPGINVDVYLLTAWPESEAERQAVLQRMVHYQKKKFRPGNLSYSLGTRRIALYKWVDAYGQKHITCPMADFLAQYPFGSTRHVMVGGQENVLFPGEAYNDKVLLPFEDGEFYAPAGYDAWLRARYGDYMQLPPVEQRHPYHGTLDCYLVEE